MSSISKIHAEKYEVKKRGYVKRSKQKRRKRNGRAGAEENSDEEYIDEEDETEFDSDSKKDSKKDKKSKNTKHLFVTHNYRTTPTSSSITSTSSIDGNHFLGENFPIASPTTKLPSNVDNEEPREASNAKLNNKLSLLAKANQLLKDAISQSDKGTEKFKKYTDLFEINMNKQLIFLKKWKN